MKAKKLFGEVLIDHARPAEALARGLEGFWRVNKMCAPRTENEDDPFLSIPPISGSVLALCVTGKPPRSAP